MALGSVTIDAGPHDRLNVPVIIAATDAARADEALSGGRDLAAQSLPDGRIALVLPAQVASERITYRLTDAAAGAPGGVRVAQEAGALAIYRDGILLTRYHYDSVPARPYFFPLNGPGGLAYTRAYPMDPGVEDESKDHPHHRSLWIAHGEVNGVDNWSEESGHGYTKHRSHTGIFSGPLVGGFEALAEWTGPDGAELLTEELIVQAWSADPACVVMDFNIRLKPTGASVLFGDTKEGGILSVRVASALDVPRGGTITNVFAGVNESETWGKSSHWCDYSGEVSGHKIGITVMDHPDSFRYPTYWHVRNYGLMTANPFAYSAYSGGAKEGSHVLEPGASLCFRYRLLLHAGSATSARVPARYLDFVAPPTASA